MAVENTELQKSTPSEQTDLISGVFATIICILVEGERTSLY